MSSIPSRFNVLDRKESVHRHLLLEASAGTGKTFSIENIVVRLLIESHQMKAPTSIENILVVTFTRIAASELKERIHSNLEKSLDLIKRWIQGENVKSQFPDYLLSYVESDFQAALKAKKLIERALFSFDKAQIFTIHGFCWRMLKNYFLEAGISLEASSREDNSLSVTQLYQVIRDFLRNELIPEVYSSQQLKLLMKRVKGKSEKLQKDLYDAVMKGINIQSTPTFLEYLAQFQEKMKTLQQRYGFEGPKIIEDFQSLAPSYKDLKNTSKQIHPEAMLKTERFAALFDKKIWTSEDFDVVIEDGLFLLEAFDPQQLKAKSKPLGPESLNYPHLLEALKEHLEALVSPARNQTLIFSRLASDCQKFIKRYQEQEEVFGHNDLLLQMKKAIMYPEFVRRVRTNFSVAIIDEFQDTDPTQWEIFSYLFAPKDCSWEGFLHLVGDPKQSIYAFRQADIYTYLSAAQHLGAESLVTLDTNFRSQSSLIDGLNTLFNSSVDTFSLPRLSQELPYRSVNVGRKDQGLGDISLCFWEVRNQSKLKSSLATTEEEYLLPAISQEILKLVKQGMRFNQFAILISDRHQTERVCRYLETLEIPVQSQKSKDISSSHAVDEMRELLSGVINYTSTSQLNIALATRVIGMTHNALLLIKDEQTLLPIIEKFQKLKGTLFEEGFAKFYHSLMSSTWHEDQKSVLERILSEPDGIVFYRMLQDLADLMIAEEQAKSLLPEGLIAFLDSFDELARNEEDQIKAYIDPDQDGVSVLTTHMSKGLEFSIVFALGLIKRTREQEDNLFPFVDQKICRLTAVENKNDPKFLKYCEESDAEKMRQLYVALTRAKDRIYIPYVIEENQKPVPFGSASPMELFIARLNKPKTSYESLYERISFEDGSTIAHLVAESPQKMSLKQLHKHSEELIEKSVCQTFTLIPPEEIQVLGTPLVMQSFTSLSQTKHTSWQSTEEEVLLAPHEFNIEDKTPHTLPSGNHTGLILHKIFENLSFDAFRGLTHPDQACDLVTPFLKGTAYVPWEEAITKMVFLSLKTRLSEKEAFCLADIDPKKIYRETEFLYSCETDHEMFHEVEAHSGFVKGVVDLFFEHEGKYYILDWKSNWLGPTNEYYQFPNLQEAMRANQYDLQAAIYYEAFKKYLRLFDKRPFEEVFGGVYYLFVRGITPITGIFKHG